MALYILCSIFTSSTVKLPWWFSSKESACNAGDLGSILGSGRSHGVENGNPFQHSCQKNPMDRGAWQATVHGVTKRQTRLKQLNTHTHTHTVKLKQPGNIRNDIIILFNTKINWNSIYWDDFPKTPSQWWSQASTQGHGHISLLYHSCGLLELKLHLSLRRPWDLHLKTTKSVYLQEESKNQWGQRSRKCECILVHDF